MIKKDKVGVYEQVAEKDACKIEHDLSDESYAAISGLLVKET